MTRWHAIVPFNHGRAVKTRLGDILTPEERSELALAMAAHVIAVLQATPEIGRVTLLAPERPALDGPDWIADQGRGLNAELAAARDGMDRTLFIHADLPLLEVDDVTALVTQGTAIAPDTDRQGTNALALSDAAPFTPFFGQDSFARHRAALPDALVVDRVGLALDVDSPAHLIRAAHLGAAVPPAILQRLADVAAPLP